MSGLLLDEIVNRTAQTLLRRARHQGRPVWARLARRDVPEGQHELRRELALFHEPGCSDEKQCAGLLRPFALLGQGVEAALLYQDDGWAPLTLSARPASPERVIDLALGACLGLETLQGRGLHHGQIEPAAFMVRADDGQVALTGLGRVGPVGRRGQVSLALSRLPWASPEETGRTPWMVGLGSDLYSLGGVLYWLLKGQLPLVAIDQVGWLYAVLARRPRPLDSAQLGLPAGLADIIHRLLQKDPARRYRTVHGLRHDLRRVRDGRGLPDGLGRHDVVDQVVVPTALVNQGPVRARLTALLDSRTGPRVISVSGAAGVGKTALVRAVLRGRSSCRVVWGVAREGERHVPLRVVRDAVAALVSSLQEDTGPEAEQTRARVRQALASLGGAIVELVPSAAALLGDPPVLMPLPPADQRLRLLRAVVRLAQASSSNARPLVIVLDELQWLDASSSAFLREIVRVERGRMTLLLLHRGAWSGVRRLLGPMRRRGLQIHQIEVEPLATEGVRGIVEAALGGEVQDRDELVRVLVEQTSGVPGDVLRRLRSAHTAGALWLDRGAARWSWRPGAFTAPLGVSDERMGALSERCIRALQVAALLGQRFQLEQVSAVLQRPLVAVAADLQPARMGGLLARARDECDPGFVDERAREAVLQALDDRRRGGIHMRLAEIFADEGSGALFEATHHCLRARELGVACPSPRVWAGRFRRSGEQALRSGGFPLAVRHLRAALDLLGADPWRSDTELSLELHLLLAQAEYANAGAERALGLTEIALRHTSEPLARASIRGVRVSLLSTGLRLPEAITEGLLGLEALGVEVPRDPAALPALLADAQEVIGGRPFAELAELPVVTDPDVVAAMDLMTALIPSAAMADPAIFPALAVRAMALVARHGVGPAAAVAAVSYGIILGGMGQPRSAYQAGRLGSSLGERYCYDSSGVMALLQYAVFIGPHHEPLAKVPPLLDRVARQALDVGSVPTFGFSLNQWLLHALLAGFKLQQLEARVEPMVAELLRYDHRMAADAARIFGQAIANLRGGAQAPARLSGQRFDIERGVQGFLSQQWPTGAYLAHIIQAWLALLFQQPERAREAVQRAAPFIRAVQGMFIEAIAETVGAVAALTLASQADGARRAELLAEAERARQALATRAPMAPANHAHRLRWIDGLRARLEGDATAAVAALQEAAALALSGGLVHDAALIEETAATFLIEEGHARRGRELLVVAWERYRAWGADAKVQDLASRFAPLLEPPRKGLPTSGSMTTEAVLKVAQGITSERTLDRLAARLLGFAAEHLGARTGALVVVEGAQLMVVARIHVGLGLVEGTVPLEHVSTLPAALIRGVLASGEELLVQDTDAQADARLQELSRGALLCLPLGAGDPPVGLLYLDNELTRGVFSPERLDVLRLVAGLVVAQLTNAHLVLQLENASEALRESHREIEDQSRDLTRVVSARTAELSRVIRHREQVLASIHEGLCVIDLDGQITYVNPALGGLTGWDSAGLVGRSLHEQLHGEPGRCVVCVVDASVVSPREEVFQHRDGSPLPVRVARRPLFSEAGLLTGAVVTLHDVSEQHRLRDQLVRVQKMEAMGRFAGGIAHELNNLLTPILFGASRLAERVDLDPAARRVVDTIERAGGRAAELVRQNLAFGRRSEIFKKQVDLVELLEEVGSFLRQTLRGQITLELRLPPGPRMSLVDPGQIQQVVLNLALNAQDAMQGEGDRPRRLSLSLQARDVAEPPPESEATPGPHLMLQVADTGTGMSESVCARIFDPFFTTKQTGEGSGLGLSVVYGILRSHGGWVECQSRLGEGTIFSCYLPELQSAATAPTPRAMPPTSAEPTRVLVVDDEALIRELAAEMLDALGYAVCLAPGGEQALARQAKDDEPIDVVLLDLSMPGMHGVEVYRRLRERRVDLPVVFCSGYSAEPVEHALRDPRVGFLSKPFTVRGLDQALRAVLD